MTFPKIYLYKQIVNAKIYIDEQFKNPDINLELIANQAHFSRFHFHRIFKQCYGKTPHQYLVYLRLKEAKRLLGENYRVKEVCHEIGFESQSSFIKLFKKHFGQTPAEYAAFIAKEMKLRNEKPLDFIPSNYANYLGWDEYSKNEQSNLKK